MASQRIVNSSFVDELFTNDLFLSRLKQFHETQRIPNQGSLNCEHKGSQLVAASEITKQISQILGSHVHSQQIEYLREELVQVQKEVSQIRLTVELGNDQKMDLEATNFHNRFDISNISEADPPNSQEILDVRAKIDQLSQKINEWFENQGQTGFDVHECQSYLGKRTKLSSLLQVSIQSYVEAHMTSIYERMDANERLAEKRTEQLTKTLNNVLQMLNQSNSKRNQEATIAAESNISQRVAISDFQAQGVQKKLTKQSSLQNLRMKNFFSFGQS